MAYFANGTESGLYFDQYCQRCIHAGTADRNENCALWDAQMIYHEREAGKPGSILHLLIPRDDQGKNLQCRLFMPRS